MKTSELVLDEVAFVADINPMDLGTGPIQQLAIGMRGQTNTTAAVVGTTLLASLSLLRIFSSGLKTELSGTDLLAYNCLVLGNVPKRVDSGATSTNPVSMTGLILPLNLPAAQKAQIQLVWVTQTNLALGVISVFAERIATLSSGLIGIQRKPLTPGTTGSYGNKVDISYQGAKLLGLLVYSTTIPTASAVTTSLHKLRLSVGGKLMLEYNWFSMGPTKNLVTGDATIDAVIDNYRWLPFEEPLDASDVKADVYADDTNAVVILPVYQFS